MTERECLNKIRCLKADTLYHEGLLFKAHKNYAKACGKFSAALRIIRLLKRDGFDGYYFGNKIDHLYRKVYEQMVRTSAIRKKAACFG